MVFVMYICMYVCMYVCIDCWNYVQAKGWKLADSDHSGSDDEDKVSSMDRTNAPEAEAKKLFAVSDRLRHK